MAIVNFNNNNKPPLSKEVLEYLQLNLLKIVFPVGSIYVTQTNINPSDESILGFGTWERLKAKFCLGVDENDTDFNQIGKTGGSKNHNHMLPIAIDSNNDNWDSLHWNNAFGYGTKQMTSPNYNQLSHSPTGQSKTMYQLQTSSSDNMPPYEVVGYIWIRRK